MDINKRHISLISLISLILIFISVLFIVSSCDGDDKSAEEWYSQGMSMEQEGNFKGAIKCYDRAIKLDKQNLIYWNAKGLALAHYGDFKKSINVFDRALKINPDDTMTLDNKKFVEIMAKEAE